MAEVKYLQTRLDEHVSECRRNFEEIESQLKGVNTRIEHMDSRIDRLIDSQEKCTKALEDLATKATGAIDTYEGFQSVVKLGITVQKFGLWLSKWPVIGIGVYTIYTWVIANLPK